MEEDKYFDYIPFTWTSSNALQHAHLGAEFLRQMMIISFLNYQVDEYMEKVVGAFASDRLCEIREMIHTLFQSVDNKLRNGCHPKEVGGINVNPEHKLGMISSSDGEFLRAPSGDSLSESEGLFHSSSQTDRCDHLYLPQVSEVHCTLSKFVTHVLHHPHILAASPSSQIYLRTQLERFLLAHVSQLKDNTTVFTQHTPPPELSFDWVRTTSAHHTHPVLIRSPSPRAFSPRLPSLFSPLPKQTTLRKQCASTLRRYAACTTITDRWRGIRRNKI